MNRRSKDKHFGSIISVDSLLWLVHGGCVFIHQHACQFCHVFTQKFSNDLMDSRALAAWYKIFKKFPQMKKLKLPSFALMTYFYL